MTELPPQVRNSIAAEAADWYARLRAPDLTELDAVRFRAWLNGDSARRREFEAIDEFWADLAGIEQLPEVSRIRATLAARRRARHPAVKGRWLIAASVVLAVIASGWVWQQRFAGRYITGIGEQRVVPLADGSVVTLNTATQVRVKYSAESRKIDLLQGQANFEVAKDTRRPFIVTAGQGQVRALGTTFDIYKSANKVTVTLIEGRVAISSPDTFAVGVPGSSGMPKLPRPDAQQPIVLSSGQQLSYGTELPARLEVTSAAKVAAVDIPRVTAWRARKLDFQNTPLSEAIAEANRYSSQQIVLNAPQLETARISGVFEAGRSDLLVEGLQTYFRLNATRASGDRIVLTLPMDP